MRFGPKSVFAAVFVLSAGLAGCPGTTPVEPDPTEPETAEPEVDEQAAIDTFVEGLGELPFTPASQEEVGVGDTTDNGAYSCTTTEMEETRAYDEVVAYAANSGSLWPGAILRGDSVYTGLFTPLVYERAPLTFSVSLESIVGAQSATMEAPSLSNYRDELGGILENGVSGATPANISAQIEIVHSSDQMALAFGAEAGWPGDLASISSSFNFASEETNSRYVVRYVQAYYSVDIDPPGNPSDLFAETVRVADLEGDMGANNPPVYVSSVTYGRMIVFTIESKFSQTEMDAALSFAYSGGSEISGDTSLTYSEMLDQSSINAYILGGNGGEAAQAIGSYEALMEFISNGGNYSAESPGAPIAYKLAYLADNAPARLSFTQDYEVTECTRVNQTVRVVATGIEVVNDGGDGGSLQLYGSLVVNRAGTSDYIDLWRTAEIEAVDVLVGATYPGAGNTLGEVLLDVDPVAGETIRLEANLNDVDIVANDAVCSTVTVDAPFVTGWRRDMSILCTGEGTQVTVHFRLDPI